VAVSRDQDEPLVAVLEDEEWTILPSLGSVWDQVPRTDRASECCGIAVEPDGTVWLAIPGGAVWFDGTGWHRVRRSTVRTGGFGNGPVWATGEDGTLWSHGRCSGDALLRHDGTGWQVWHVVSWDGCAAYGADATVGPDGTVWLRFSAHADAATKALVQKGIIEKPGSDATVCHAGPLNGPEPGVLSFDGKRWRQYLAGRCLSGVAVASDGSVWVTDRGTESDGQGAGLYVITPEAVAGILGGPGND
jgi:hypothetical protein